jgi:hypothetical protein
MREVRNAKTILIGKPELGKRDVFGRIILKRVLSNVCRCGWIRLVQDGRNQ